MQSNYIPIPLTPSYIIKTSEAIAPEFLGGLPAHSHAPQSYDSIMQLKYGPVVTVDTPRNKWVFCDKTIDKIVGFGEINYDLYKVDDEKAIDAMQIKGNAIIIVGTGHRRATYVVRDGNLVKDSQEVELDQNEIDHLAVVPSGKINNQEFKPLVSLRNKYQTAHKLTVIDDVIYQMTEATKHGLKLTEEEATVLNTLAATSNGQELQGGIFSSNFLGLIFWLNKFGISTTENKSSPNIVARNSEGKLTVLQREEIFRLFYNEELHEEKQPLIQYLNQHEVTLDDGIVHLNVKEETCHFSIDTKLWNTAILPQALARLKDKKSLTAGDLYCLVPCLVDKDFTKAFWKRLFHESDATIKLADDFINHCFTNQEEHNRILSVKNGVNQRKGVFQTLKMVAPALAVSKLVATHDVEKNQFLNQQLPQAKKRLAEAKPLSIDEIKAIVPCLIDDEITSSFWRKLYNNPPFYINAAIESVNNHYANDQENLIRILNKRLEIFSLDANGIANLDNAKKTPTVKNPNNTIREFWKKHKSTIAIASLVIAVGIASVFTAGIAGAVGAAFIGASAASAGQITVGALVLSTLTLLMSAAIKSIVDYCFPTRKNKKLASDEAPSQAKTTDAITTTKPSTDKIKTVATPTVTPPAPAVAPVVAAQVSEPDEPAVPQPTEAPRGLSPHK